jgi:hypothetical protein
MEETMFSNFKKRLGVFTAIAVMSALVPALSTSVASAAPTTAATAVSATDVTTLKACPASASTPAAGFTDTTSTDVDCIAYYGITTGVTATTYEPSANIPRWQMALYLTRFMDVAGLTLGSGADQGFTDISGYSAAIQTAINQIKQAGVTTGKTATTYDPDSNVSNEEMAMFVTRALGQTPVGQNGSNDTVSSLTLYINGTTATYNYDDIDSGVTFEGHNAIIETFHLGLTGDLSTDRTFSPSADITRADMATWLTNALAHTHARPTGLHLQSTDVADFGSMAAGTDELHISNRDASFDAIANTSVDVMAFYDDPADTTDLAVVAATGKCDDMVTAQSSTLCTIDVGDSVTNASGNIVLEMGSMAAGDASVGDGQTVQYWAWTAANGTVYVSTTHTASTVTIVSTTDATQLKVTSSQAKARRTATPEGIQADTNLDGVSDTGSSEVNFSEAAYGSTVTLTFQAYDSATVNAVVAKPLVLVTIVDAYGTPGAQPTSVTTTLAYTGADGSVTYDMVCGADPLPLAASTESYRRITWTSTLTDNNLSGTTTDGAEEFFYCTDKAAYAATSTLAITDKYKSVDLAATLTPVTSTVTGTVYDQYGNTLANQAVAFDSDMTDLDAAAAAEGLLDGTKRTTNGSGQASASLSRTTATTGMETISFCVDDSTDGCLAGSDTAEITANIFWVTANDGTADTGGGARTTAGAANGLSVEVADTPNDVLIVRGSTGSANTYTKVPYDANDQFRDNPSLAPISMSDFETLATAAGCTVLTGYECTWDWNLGNFDYNAVAINGTGGISQFDAP